MENVQIITTKFHRANQTMSTIVGDVTWNNDCIATVTKEQAEKLVADNEDIKIFDAEADAADTRPALDKIKEQFGPKKTDENNIEDNKEDNKEEKKELTDEEKHTQEQADKNAIVMALNAKTMEQLWDMAKEAGLPTEQELAEGVNLKTMKKAELVIYMSNH